MDAPPADPHGQALGLETAAAAGRADILGQGRFAPLVDLGPVAEAVAVRAGAVRAVEGEIAGLELGQADVAGRADQAQGEVGLAAVGPDQENLAVRDVQGGLDRFAQAGLGVGGDPQLVHQDFGRVGLGPLQDDRAVQVAEAAVHPNLDEALLEQAVEELVVLALAAADDRGQEADLLPGRGLANAGYDLLGRLLADFAPAGRAVWRPDPGEEQAQQVVGLGHRAHGRAGVGRDRLLVDGDGGRDAFDGLHLGLLHHLHVLPGVGRHALDIAALALGEQGVESQRGLARAAGPGDDDELMARQADVDPLQDCAGTPS